MHNERISYLLKQYLDNSITMMELHEMMELLQQEKASGEIQAVLELIIDQSPALPDYREDDWDPLYRKILARKEEASPSEGEGRGEEPARGRVMTLFKKKWRITAAAVLILFAGGAGILSYKHTGRKDLARSVAQKPASLNDVAPGSDKAVLTLADGSTINLDDAKTGIVGQQGNSRLIKQQGALLAYQHETAKSRHPAEIEYNLLTTPRGGQYRLILPDGSKVWLNAASSLKYPTSFTGKERVVELQGEAYFEIAKNASMPFKVSFTPPSGGRGEIEVLGTSFNVMAYMDESTVNTTLLEGSVQVHNGAGTSLIRPGEQAQLNKAGDFKVAPADTEEAIAWKNGLFKFNEATIEEVMRQVSRWYDVEVVYVNEAPKDLFRGEIYRNVNVSKVLKVLEASGIHFTVSGKKILVQS